MLCAGTESKCCEVPCLRVVRVLVFMYRYVVKTNHCGMSSCEPRFSSIYSNAKEVEIWLHYESDQEKEKGREEKGG